MSAGNDIKIAGHKPLLIHRTPHEIAVNVAHHNIRYGQIIEELPDVLPLLKQAIFEAVCDEIIAATRPANPKVGQ